MRLFSKKSAAPDETLEALRGEYQNYRRRTAAQLERAEADGMKKAVLALLPVYDDLARALDAPCTDEAYYHGVELLMQKLLQWEIHKQQVKKKRKVRLHERAAEYASRQAR